MTTDTVRRVEDITPITFDTDAREIALAVADRLLALLRELCEEDWSARTECPAWDVADMVGHVIGAAKSNASVRESFRQQLWARRHKHEFDANDLDAVNALHVRMHASLSPAERVTALSALVPAAVAGRMRFPRPLRRIRVPLAQSGSVADGMPTSLSLGHLNEVIYTRDMWLHRVDIARATGKSLHLVPEVDGRVVEDVVREWALRHGQPFTLTLTGPAGGAFVHGEGGTSLELDAVEFCRVLSGRAPGEGLLGTRVLF